MDPIWLLDPCECGAGVLEECRPGCVSWSWCFQAEKVEAQ